MKKKLKSTAIVKLFQSNPEKAYSELLYSRCYLRNHLKQKNPLLFWDNFESLNLDDLVKVFPGSVKTLNKVIRLKYFCDLNELYLSEKSKCFTELFEINPDPSSFVKSLYLSLELGESTRLPNDYSSYTEESLMAIRSILKYNLPKLKSAEIPKFTPELFEVANNLIRIETDISLLMEFVDAYVWADFELLPKDIGYKLRLPKDCLKIDNLYVLNEIKTKIKRDFYREESHSSISDESHFKKIDPSLKTNEGLATCFLSSGDVVSKPKGTTTLKISTKITDALSTSDKELQEQAVLETLSLSQEQNFHYQFRQALSRVYHPNDKVDIHSLHIEVKENVFVTLFDLICVMSCFIAKADTYRYIGDFPLKSIKSIKSQFINALKKEKPELNEDELNNSVNTIIVSSFNEIEQQENVSPFVLVDQKKILSWMSKIDELNCKSIEELNAMIDLLTGFDSPLPMNPLYKLGDAYFFSYTSCVKFNLNQYLYDYYISDKLYNNHKAATERDKDLVWKNHKSREVKITNSLKEAFKYITDNVEAGLDYSKPNHNYDFGDLEGETDLIAYFKEENILMPIEVKLSNASARSENRKELWINSHLREKGIKQVIRDKKLLSNKAGLKFIADNLDLTGEIHKPLIYPLIVTDNFYYDHQRLSFNESDNVLCVSYFELTHILQNKRIDKDQESWLPFEKGKAANSLIKMLEGNTFWSFLDEKVKDFSLSKSLIAINDENKIEITI